ncbi:MAG: lipocalin family protein [Prevotella sp.]|nr:lipocalin family protein [Prevotella sp.]
MKHKILFGMIALFMGVLFAACSDDEFSVATTPLLKDGSVVTGSADVTATTALMHGTVSGLDGQSAGAYTAGFYYGEAADELTGRVVANSDAAFSASLSGQPGEVYYYQAFVTLQGRMTYTGEVKSFILTDAKAVTAGVTDITANTARLAGALDKFPAEAEAGIVVSGVAGDENVRAGVRIAGTTAADYNVTASGLLPSTTYYYAAYLDLGVGVVYGETRSFTTASRDFDVNQEFVDLGLSTKWARCNLGASSETETGGLFGFGDMTGYNTSIDIANYASGDIYRTASDVANRVYGGKATMPTIAEFEELFRCCRVEWAETDGVAGYRFTGPNGNSIFLPAAGSGTKGVTSGASVEGRYLSGSANVSDPQFAMSYLFTNSGHARTTTPVYQALSVRPVSVAKNVALDKSLLCKTWEIDLTDNGEYKVFPGPTYFYGMDDSWNTVTNNEPVVGDSWAWEPDFAGNSWAVGGDAKNCRGSITFNEDGTVKVKHITADGIETEENGTYTVDEQKKTITLKGAKVLAPANYTDDYVNSLTDDIRILSLTEGTLQLGVIRTNDPALLSINMIPQQEKYGYTAKLTCYGQGPSGEPSDAWASATTTVAGGKTGTYTLTFTTSEPRVYGQVYVIDIENFAAAYPNAFVRVESIKADGNDVPFDANKFFYGNIEDGGTFRVELANIWGCGHNDSWNGLADTPFHPGGGETTAETALAFNSTFEVVFSVVSLDADLSFTVKQTAVGLLPAWAGNPGNWGKEYPGALKIVQEGFRYKVANAGDLAMTLDASECDGTPDEGAVNMVDVVGIRSFFPAFTAELVSVNSDGNDVPFNASKLITGDIEDNGNFRIELHNIWGAGTAADPAFGDVKVVEGNNCVTSLGFKNSLTYTIGRFSEKLFATPW